LYVTHVAAGQETTGASLALPTAVPGWRQTAQPFIDWKPHYLHFSEALSQGYVSPNGPLGLYVAFYRHQRAGSELIGWGNDIVFNNESSRGEWYRVAGPYDQSVSFRGKTLSIPMTRISNGRQNLDVWHWYWIDGQFTASAMAVKALTLKARLLDRSDAGALITVYMPAARSETESKTKLADFINEALPAIERNLKAAGGG
ncbi:MAG TPA: EpsI family protein, partial [Nitrococcus sp.]|nr:EpsI family protein [Nitrococcus sp.]